MPYLTLKRVVYYGFLVIKKEKFLKKKGNFNEENFNFRHLNYFERF